MYTSVVQIYIFGALFVASNPPPCTWYSIYSLLYIRYITRCVHRTWNENDLFCLSLGLRLVIFECHTQHQQYWILSMQTKALIFMQMVMTYDGTRNHHLSNKRSTCCWHAGMTHAWNKIERKASLKVITNEEYNFFPFISFITKRRPTKINHNRYSVSSFLWPSWK